MGGSACSGARRVLSEAHPNRDCGYECDANDDRSPDHASLCKGYTTSFSAANDYWSSGTPFEARKTFGCAEGRLTATEGLVPKRIDVRAKRKGLRPEKNRAATKTRKDGWCARYPQCSRGGDDIHRLDFQRCMTRSLAISDCVSTTLGEETAPASSMGCRSPVRGYDESPTICADGYSTRRRRRPRRRPVGHRDVHHNRIGMGARAHFDSLEAIGGLADDAKLRPRLSNPRNALRMAA
jgi:hypothetical protein